MDKHHGPAPHTQPTKSASTVSKKGAKPTEETSHKDVTSGDRTPTPPNGSPNGSRASLAHSRRGSQTSHKSLTPQQNGHEDATHNEEQGSDNGSQQGSRTSTPTNQDHENHETFERSRSPSVHSDTQSHYEPVAPEDFDTKSFLSSISDLSQRLQSDSLRSFDTDFDADEMKSVVSAVTVSMENFRNYTTYSQQHLERLREQVKETKDRMHRKIQLKPYDPSSGTCINYTKI